MKKKKLGILINALEIGGAEKVVSQLINYFSNDFDIHLILLNDTIEYELPFNNITVKIIDNSNLKASNRTLDILKIPILSRRLKKYLEQNDIHVCFSALNRSNFINCFLRILNWKGKIIISERSHTSSVYSTDSISGKTGRSLVKLLYKKADVIVPNSAGIEYDLRTTFKLKNNFRVIHNPVNIQQQQKDIQEEVSDVQFESFTFSHVGRMERSKNHEMLLAAIAKIKEKDFKVLIIGHGEQEKIKTLAKEAGVFDKLVFLGYRNNVVKYISHCQCHVMTSIFEGFPNVLLEALAGGVPVISTDCPTGPAEILSGQFIAGKKSNSIEKERFGILVPVSDANKLAEAMLMMMNEKPLQQHYASIGKERAKDFGLPVIMKQYAELLEYYVGS